jgi:glycerophosphoryl diester phosphodiesterase
MPATILLGMDFAFLDYPGPIPFAHRGGGIEGIENTMSAFERSVALGYRYLETDVHMTADGVLLAFHDDDLSRTCGRQGKISELPWSDVQTARVDGKEPIPLLEDVLGHFPEARINIEPKSSRAVDAFIEVVRRTGSTGRICVGSFDGKRIQRVRAALGPTLCTSMGPTEIARWLAANWMPAGWGIPRVPVAQVPLKWNAVPIVTARTVREAHAHGIQVHVWTIDDPGEMDRLLDLGVDGIMTDQPSVLKAVLQRRGQWFG